MTFLFPSPMKSTTTTSVPQDKSVLLSSIESWEANLKSELVAEAKDSTGDEGDLDLQQFLSEIKDEDKEHVFVDQIDEGPLDGKGYMMKTLCSGFMEVSGNNKQVLRGAC